MIELIPSPDSIMQILKKRALFARAISFIQTASTRRIIFKCRWRFVTTTRREFWPSP